MTDSIAPFVLAVLRARVDAGAAKWLENAAAADSPDAVYAAYTAAPQHTGRAPLTLTGDERARLSVLAPKLSCDRCTIDDVARLALLVAAADRLDEDRFVDVATECFERGDAR